MNYNQRKLQRANFGLLSNLVFIALLTILAYSGYAQTNTVATNAAASTAVLVSSPPIDPGAPAWVVGVATKYPWVVTVLAIVGVLRLLLKPTFAYLHSIVAATPTTKDDEILEKVELSPIVKWICFGLDWLCSVKLIK